MLVSNSTFVIKINCISVCSERFMIYRLSYLWYCIIGTFVAMFVGLLVSFMTKPLDPRDVDPKLLAPFVRKLIKPRKYPNEPDEGIIYAYGVPKKNNVSRQNTQGIYLFQFSFFYERPYVKL